MLFDSLSVMIGLIFDLFHVFPKMPLFIVDVLCP